MSISYLYTPDHIQFDDMTGQLWIGRTRVEPDEARIIKLQWSAIAKACADDKDAKGFGDAHRLQNAMGRALIARMHWERRNGREAA